MADREASRQRLEGSERGAMKLSPQGGTKINYLEGVLQAISPFVCFLQSAFYSQAVSIQVAEQLHICAANKILAIYVFAKQTPMHI